MCVQAFKLLGLFSLHPKLIPSVAFIDSNGHWTFEQALITLEMPNFPRSVSPKRKSFYFLQGESTTLLLESIKDSSWNTA